MPCRQVLPLAQRLLEACQDKLGEAGRTRDLAAQLLGKLLPRPDMGPALDAFLTWAAVKADTPGASAAFIIPGEALSAPAEEGQGSAPPVGSQGKKFC